MIRVGIGFDPWMEVSIKNNKLPLVHLSRSHLIFHNRCTSCSQWSGDRACRFQTSVATGTAAQNCFKKRHPEETFSLPKLHTSHRKLEYPPASRYQRISQDQFLTGDAAQITQSITQSMPSHRVMRSSLHSLLDAAFNKNRPGFVVKNFTSTWLPLLGWSLFAKAHWSNHWTFVEAEPLKPTLPSIGLRSLLYKKFIEIDVSH